MHMNPGGFWCTLENLIGRECKRAASKDGYDVGKWILALPSIDSKTDESLNFEPVMDLPADNQHESDVGEGQRRKKKRKRKKFVQKVVTRKMAQAEEMRRQVDEKIYSELSIPLPVEYRGPQIDLSFNLPRVTAQLEKLMGTNVVRLTDRKYMQELQKRIKEDYCATLEKRISNRVFNEEERQKHLILNGSYNIDNCPRNLIPLHSIVLAKEMDREKNLLLHGQGEKQPNGGSTAPDDQHVPPVSKIPDALVRHPVFLTNQKTNQMILKKRSHLKTVREKNAERLVKQGMKWEKERLLQAELDRQKEIEAKQRREKLLETEQLYTVETNDKGVDLQRIKSRKYTEPEIDLKNFLLSEREANFKKQTDPFRELQTMMSAKSFVKKIKKKKEEKDLLEAQVESMAGKQSPDSPEEGYGSSTTEFDSVKSRPITPTTPRKDAKKGKKGQEDVKLPTALQKKSDSEKTAKPKKEVKILLEVKVDEIDDLSGVNLDNYKDTVSDAEHQKSLDATAKEEAEKGNILPEPNFKLLNYEDPRIIQLKTTDNVAAMYKLADDIIIGDLKRKGEK